VPAGIVLLINTYYAPHAVTHFLGLFSLLALTFLVRTNLATIKTAPGEEKNIERALAKRYPDITLIPVGDALNQAASIPGQLSTAVNRVGGPARPPCVRFVGLVARDKTRGGRDRAARSGPRLG